MRHLMIATLAVGLTAGTASAATLTAIDDTILLQNGVGSSAADYNFGGRNEMILGGNGSSTTAPRHGLFRFDVSSIAAQITAGTDIESATLTLTERTTRDTLNGNLSQTFSVFDVVSDNEGWVEGSSTGGAAETGAASYSYLAYNTQNWDSNSLFTFGTDTGASLGSGTVNFATGSQQTLVITITDLTGLKTLLAEWLAADTSSAGTNAGLAIQSAGTNQLFFESIESGAGTTPAQLDINFVVPEPSAIILAACGLLGMIGFAWRRRRSQTM